MVACAAPVEAATDELELVELVDGVLVVGVDVVAVVPLVVLAVPVVAAVPPVAVALVPVADVDVVLMATLAPMNPTRATIEVVARTPDANVVPLMARRPRSRI